MFKEKHTAAVLMSGFFMSVVAQAFVSTSAMIRSLSGAQS
jgi:hypothetical protein